MLIIFLFLLIISVFPLTIVNKNIIFFVLFSIAITLANEEEGDVQKSLGLDSQATWLLSSRGYHIPTKMEYHKTHAQTNYTFRCAGATENILIEYLEWLCLSKHKKVLEFRKDSGATYFNEWKNRVQTIDNYGLEILNVSAIDNGYYICLINHRLMPDALIKFVVIDVPDPPGRALITFFTSRTANLSWAHPRIMNHSDITHYTVIVRKHFERPDPDEEELTKNSNFTATRVNTTSNDGVIHVHGLRPYTVYSFQVIAWNNIGPSNPSKPSYYLVTLRELPECRIPFSVRNISSTSVFISWEAPDIDYVNGDFLGYRLTWEEYDNPSITQEKYIRNCSVTKHIIAHLLPHTRYFIGLSVFNPEGYGPNTTLLIITDEGPPSSPRNLTVVNPTETTLTLHWLMPDKPNGELKGYRIYFSHGNVTDMRRDAVDPLLPVKTFFLDGLKPDTVYSIIVKAFSTKHEGNDSLPAVGKTDIMGPSAPILTNVSCEYNSSVLVEFKKPEKFSGPINSYKIQLLNDGVVVKNMTVEAEKKHVAMSYIFQNVTPNIHYEVQVQAGSRSNRTANTILGEKSKLAKVLVTDGCRLPSDQFKEIWAGVLAGFLCAIGVLILGGGIYLIWKKFLQPPYYYLDNTQCTPASLDWNNHPTPANEVEEEAVSEEERRKDYSGPIEVSQFAEHVQKLHADGDIGFSKEYDAIQNDPTNEGNSSENSQHPDNKPKNRYLNIIAYDHSRVQLLPMPGHKVSTYINANYIDGFQVNRAYIGTQGPLPSTFDCFWRMIWEQRVTIIVMITNLVERGRRKCDMYWPKDGSEVYGLIEVKLLREDVMATYTVRTLVIRHTKVKKFKDGTTPEKTVYQYHYTNWPDHGTPDHPLPVISFVKKSSEANPPDSGPIVVHCSAGVGRTGTYIVLDAMLKQIKARGEVNIFGFLRHIRAQRNFLVQTEEQYIFIHDALVEAIQGGETDIPIEQFATYVEALQNPDSAVALENSWKPLTVQFEQATKFQPRDFNLVSANKPVNQPKNRCGVLVPTEGCRVHLTPRPGEDGSDYINATWLPGFNSLREFIITQHPLSREDFWKMCWDHACQLIVMLSVIEDEEFPRFWPEGDEIIESDSYTCQQVNVITTGTYVTRDFLLKSVQDDYEIKMKFVESIGWPHKGVASIKHMYDFPNHIINIQKIGQGPICVVDRLGGTEAATFCTLVSLKKHLAYEHKVDVYMYAKLYHNKRPGIWASADDYMKLHLCIQSLDSDIESIVADMPPDFFTLSNGVGKNCITDADNPTEPQPGCSSRSSNGFPGSVAIPIENDFDAPSTSKEACAALSQPDTKDDAQRIPPEGMETGSSVG